MKDIVEELGLLAAKAEVIRKEADRLHSLINQEGEEVSKRVQPSLEDAMQGARETADALVTAAINLEAVKMKRKFLNRVEW